MSEPAVPMLEAATDRWVDKVCAVAGLGRIAGTTDRAEYDRRWRALQPDLQIVLGNRYGDVSGIRARRDVCVETAGRGDHAGALGILLRLEAMVADALETGILSAEAVPRAAVPFVKARLLWRQARLDLRAEIARLESAIVAVCRDDPELVEVIARTDLLYDHIEGLDERLEDRLDAIAAAADGPERAAAMRAAHALIGEYRAVLAGGFFGDVDDNGFVAVAVAATARAALARIEALLD